MKEIIKQLGVKKCSILVIAALALFILSIPKNDQTQTSKEEEVQEMDTDESVEDLEQRLVKILSKVEGVGKVSVMITLKSSGEAILNKDQPYTKEENKEKDAKKTSIHQEEETILVDGTNGSEPYVIKELKPEVEGVVLIAEGGDIPSVQEKMTEAVIALFDVPAHKVKVLKMGEGK